MTKITDEQGRVQVIFWASTEEEVGITPNYSTQNG